MHASVGSNSQYSQEGIWMKLHGIELHICLTSGRTGPSVNLTEVVTSAGKGQLLTAHPPLLLIFQLLSGFSKDKVNEQRRMCEGEWIAFLSKRNKGMFIFIDMGTWYMISCCSNNTPWISYNPVSAVGDLDLKDALSLISADHCWIASLVVLFTRSKVITILP